MVPARGGSASIAAPDYWWYRARSELLRVVLEPYLQPEARVLDVGSADGPSVSWLRTKGLHVSMDLDPRGLGRNGVCGSALALPFADSSFDVVAAFDVVEHCDPEKRALDEITRVLEPGGALLMSVPAYQWAWSDFDVQNGHHRRYTRGRAARALARSGLEVQRATYAFTGVFPFFAAERQSRRLRGRAAEAEDVVTVPHVPAAVEAALLFLSRMDSKLLARRDLPFGSSVLVAARKPLSGSRPVDHEPQGAAVS
jgi:SAM-dependent methyltransferase